MEEHERRRICRQAIDNMEEALRERAKFQKEESERKHELEELQFDMTRALLELQRLNSLPIPSGIGRFGGVAGIAAEIARQRQIGEVESRISRLKTKIDVAKQRVQRAMASLEAADRSLRRAGDLHRRLGCSGMAPTSLVRP